MTPDDALREAHEKNLIGWDRGTVVEIIGRTISLLNQSTSAVERHLSTWQEKVDTDFGTTWSRVAAVGDMLYAECQAHRKTVNYDILRKHYVESQSLKAAIKEMSDLIMGSPAEIIKLAKDLTTIAEKLLVMNDKVAASFPDVGSKESDEYLNYLDAEQTLIVMGWVEEKKAIINGDRST